MMLALDYILGLVKFKNQKYNENNLGAKYESHTRTHY